MSVEQDLNNRLKTAMREKRRKELALIRMLKTKASEVKTSAGFDGNSDDSFWMKIIQQYAKQQAKALEEFKNAGAQGAEHVEQLTYEIEYLQPFMPKLLDEAAVRPLVQQAIEKTGAEGAKMVGRVIGVIMSQHREEVDASMVTRIALEELG